MRRSAVRYCVGPQRNLPVGLLTHWTVCRLTHPLTPPYTGEPSHIPLREVEGWIRFMVEARKSLAKVMRL
jgi:hypothetical protein